MNTNDSERLRRENEELRSQLRAKTRENSELSARVARLTEVVEDLKQDKEVLRENAKYGKESLARLKEEIAQENSLKNTRIRELEIMLEAAKQPTLVSTIPFTGNNDCSLRGFIPAYYSATYQGRTTCLSACSSG
jgi:outer membrane murein-binding lipoprotein Lpp